VAERQHDRYALLEEIGQGGMGTVYRGRDRQSDNRVAIKRLRAGVVDAKIVERFRREGDLLRRLNHPNIVQLLDAYESQGEHYLVMEYVEGGSLRQELDRVAPLPLRRALSISIEVADALTRAHHLGVVHRDIKPANILLARDGTPRLADFGIARTANSNLTETGMLVGTLAYVSPEALRGQKADPRSDIWSFGVMLYEMVTGALPFGNEKDVGALIRSILEDSVPDLETLRSDLPVGFVDLIYRMLAKEPAERISSFRLVGAELEAVLEGKGSPSAVGAARPRYDFTVAGPSPNNLPTPTTPFLGRADEVAELKQLLTSSRARLITILAQGGMGKTRLSLEVARHVARHFAQGATFVSLARIDSAQFLAQTIAEELRLSLSSREDPKVQLLDYVRNAEMLLVLDNFEHVLEGYGVVQELLESSRGLSILATSRERLNLQGEVVLHLGSMKTAEWESIDEALTYSVVQLFMQGARRARAGFALQPSDLSGLTRICRLMEGLPLAILLAAAWVDVLSVDEIGVEIEKSSALLETELKDVPERHRSLRSVVDSTWRRLESPEQELFARLSVFRSSFNRQAAEEVAGASLRSLSKLVSKSLLVREAESGRYRVHEVLRRYAQERLQASELEDRNAHKAHGVFFAGFMQERWKHLKDHRTKAALQEIKDDIENVRAAWRYWLEERDATQLRKFFESFWMAHETWGWFRPAVDLFREAISLLEGERAESDGLESIRAFALAEEGWFSSLLGSPEVGIGLAQASLETLRPLDEDLYLPISSLNINAIFLNRLQEVETGSRAMLEGARRRGDRWQESFGFIWSAYTHMAVGRPTEAQQDAEAALAILERLQNPFGVSVAAGIVLGAVHMAQGQMQMARRAYERGLEAAESIEYRRVVQLTYDSLGTIALLAGQMDDAESYFTKSLRITFESGQTREQLGSLRDLASVYKSQGNLEKAVEFLAVVLGHPAREQNSLSRRESLKSEAERLLAEIGATLAVIRYKSAWQRGTALELGKVVAELLREERPPSSFDQGTTPLSRP
jgi:serine/threonine protein kinase/tetratricopeptide (TPR) repeat protein